MRLADFIRENKQPIIGEWENFARTLTPAAHMTTFQLRDHIEQILSFIAEDLESPQTAGQQIKKSHGKNDSVDSQDSAAEIHGNIRHDEGFDIVQMVFEYRALRSSVIKLWTNANRTLSDEDVLDLTRFNESIDQALAESVVKFTQKVDYSKDLLLGVLGHDIRSPLGAMNMCAQLIPRVGTLNDKQCTNHWKGITQCIRPAGMTVPQIVQMKFGLNTCGSLDSISTLFLLTRWRLNSPHLRCVLPTALSFHRYNERH